MKRILFLLCFGILFQCLAAEIFINVPRLDAEPPMNSAQAHSAWEQCAKFFGFRKLENQRPAENPTSYALGEYDGNLFIMIRCDYKAGKEVKLRQQVRTKDGKIFTDDSVDLAIALPGRPSKEYYQFTLNSINTRYDAHLVDIGWDGKWQSAAEYDSRGYTLFYKIPFSDFGLNQVPEELKMNIGRTVTGDESEQSVLLHQKNPDCFFLDMQSAVSLRFAPRSPVLAVTPGPEFEKG
ncbi:MAG: hypothetical protein J6S21_03345, partial [Victivallales bacterium]|nr:hypothetical protein [Victivallales bacterium]